MEKFKIAANGLKLKITKIIFIICFTLSKINTFALEIIKNDNYIVSVKLGKCKMIPQRRVIEISSENKSVLSIEKDLLTNKICLKGKKLGSSKVSMLLFDGSGTITWYVQVIQPTRKVKRKRKILKSNDKASKFDKDLKIPHKLSGWK